MIFRFLLTAIVLLLLGSAANLKAGDTTSVTVTDSVGKPVYEVIDSIFRPLERSAMNTEFFWNQGF